MPQNCRKFQITRDKIVYTRHCYHAYVSQVERNFDQARTDLFTVLFILVMVESLNEKCDFETPIPHYISSVGRN